jgi:hypothetical protein
MSWFFSKPAPPPKTQAPALQTFDDIVESHPELRGLLATLTGRIDIPEMNDAIARSIVKTWPQRHISPVTRQQVTPAEVLKEISNPCFIKDIRQIRADLTRIPTKFKDQGPKFIEDQIDAVLYEVALGFAEHHKKNVRLNPDGTLMSGKDKRSATTFGDPPCNLKMLRSDFEKLDVSEQDSIREFYRKNSQIGDNFLIEGGKRRKTKKRKARKTKRRVLKN